MSNAELFTSQTTAPKRVAIIGGGIAAVTLADAIFNQAPDTEVHLYCQDEAIATRGSGNKQGAIYPLLQGSQSVIAEFYALTFDYAIDYFQQQIKDGLEVQHGFTGVLQQAIKPELEPRLAKVAQVWPQQCCYISAEQSSKIANIPLPYPSLFFANAGWIWPAQFCQNKVQQLAQHFNLTLHLNTSVTDTVQCPALQEKDSAKWQLKLADGKIESEFDSAVICAGHQSNRLPNADHVPLQSVRGQVSRLHSQTPLAKLSTVLCHKGYITPNQGEYQCFGATFIKDSDDEGICRSDRDKNISQLHSVYAQQSWAQAITDADVIGDNAAIRAMSPDHLPIVGELFSNQWIKDHVDKNTGKLKRIRTSHDQTSEQSTNVPANSDLLGLYVFTGLGARGLTSAPMLAQHLVAQMFGLPSPLPTRLQKAVSSKRFQIKQLKKNKGI